MKQSVDDLAIFGGTPMFSEIRHVGRPNLGDRAALMRRLEDMLDRNWLSNDGPLVQEFEQRVAERLDVEHCIATCNGTLALEITARALALEGEVIVPSFTFVASVHSLAWQQIKPVFCDIDPATHTIDPDRVIDLITPQTAAILGVHLWGFPCAVGRLADIADEHDIPLIYDAAHAFDCAAGGRMIGNFGIAEVFSFHATKFVNTFEGGAVVTNDAELADQLRLLRNFGFAGYDEVVGLGTNAKMSEPAAAMGLTSIEGSPEVVARNRANHEFYSAHFKATDGVQILKPTEEPANYQYVVAMIDPDATGLHRDVLIDLLWDENLRARRYFYPGVHRMEPYLSLDPDASSRLPVTESVSDQVLVLPTGMAMDQDAIGQTAGVIEFALAHAEEISGRYSTKSR